MTKRMEDLYMNIEDWVVSLEVMKIHFQFTIISRKLVVKSMEVQKAEDSLGMQLDGRGILGK